MIISFSKKFIFFKPIKTGGSSIEDALAEVCDPTQDIISSDEHRPGVNHETNAGRVFNHIRLPQFLQLGIITLEQFKQDFHKITICRNPWDKQVSSFWHVAALNKSYDGLTRDQIKERYLNDFRSYILRICRDGKEGQQAVSREFFFYSDGTPFYDTCIRFEYLQRDFDKLCMRLRLPQRILPRLKIGTRLMPESYRHYYTNDLREIVEECYKEAIIHFQYNF